MNFTFLLNIPSKIVLKRGVWLNKWGFKKLLSS